MTSARTPLLALGLTALALAAVTVHAETRAAKRRGEQAAIDAVTRLLPASDLAFAGSARHLRFPSLEEPGAAFSDAPASPDLDPAGAAVAPPIGVYVEIPAPAPRATNARPLGQVVPR
ncbi:MAG: hypothetical protein ABW133_00780 [Polyangiaceae bacterium]